jgi:hypothetical protein
MSLLNSYWYKVGIGPSQATQVGFVIPRHASYLDFGLLSYLHMAKPS